MTRKHTDYGFYALLKNIWKDKVKRWIGFVHVHVDLPFILYSDVLPPMDINSSIAWFRLLLACYD